METISIFDIFKIGVGPSSSHTMGPWKAAQDFLHRFKGEQGSFAQVREVAARFFGSLAKTGKGHGSDVAVLMGWSGADIETFAVETLWETVRSFQETGRAALLGEKAVPFRIDFNAAEVRQGHPNAMAFVLSLADGDEYRQTYYSLGGGFIRREGAADAGEGKVAIPFPASRADELLGWTSKEGKSIAEISMANERCRRSEAEIRGRLRRIRRIMTESMYLGCHGEGELPGGLHVQRRAPKANFELLRGKRYDGEEAWIAALETCPRDMRTVTRWVSCLAMAVNEVNAAYGRIVTSPTNGSAGVIPAVLFYCRFFTDAVTEEQEDEFLMVAGEIGCLFKKGATLAAAEGGCQAEIGVSSAMAAGALTHVLGGSARQMLMAAEIAMEHHLGLTCDPVGGLVQIPCIERNAMGAMKAITAAEVALHSDPDRAKVSLDDVIATMWRTAQDMRTQYKETSEGGLAVQISIGQPAC